VHEAQVLQCCKSLIFLSAYSARRAAQAFDTRAVSHARCASEPLRRILIYCHLAIAEELQQRPCLWALKRSVSKSTEVWDATAASQVFTLRSVHSTSSGRGPAQNLLALYAGTQNQQAFEAEHNHGTVAAPTPPNTVRGLGQPEPQAAAAAVPRVKLVLLGDSVSTSNFGLSDLSCMLHG